MIITCPECKSRFRLNIYEANAVKNQGRILHCGKCDHEWEHKPIVPAKIQTPMEKKRLEKIERQKIEKSEKIINLTEFVAKKQMMKQILLIKYL